MSLKNKRILIIGGAGFIGSNLQKKLTELGTYFEVFDRIQGQDIENQKQVENFIKKKFDVIFHLAGTSGSAISNADPIRSFRINTFATLNLCELIIKYSPQTKLIISSSRLEYGKPQYLPVNENHPTAPTSAYGLSKLAGTQMALVYKNNYNLDVIIFRTSNVYGPHPTGRFSGYNVVNHFIDLAKQGKDLTIFGDGKQIRDYLFIDDLTSVFILTANSQSPQNPIFNLGLGKPVQFIEMAKTIIRKVGKGKLKFVKWPKDFESVETGDYVSDISKIKKEQGFEPRFNFEEGITRTISQG